ncbi:Corticotropin-releasing factor receptor 1 [Folsomia candida]|uniref:Corticotropin-releasing factor receptor 1 n=1 Tax=Folsomia candida TaxID=158441 RepID=A0A226E178_FOLCA|nr:Corticotropin-releasing factor receptor 1 [Folsomia candida]
MISTISHFHLLFAPLPHPTGRFLVKTLSSSRYAAEYEEERDLVVQVRYILFIGSILSFVCLVSSLFIFYYFKCLRCDRVTVHVHLMVALTLRCILLVVITEPFIFHREKHYRNVDFVCKTVLSINLYATVTSIHWMFLQGVYLHGKLTTNVFDKGTPFKIYYAVGWGLPLVLICSWASAMEMFHPVECWKDYSDQPYIWVLLGPMICALVANLLFLINIMRILLTKIQLSTSSGDAAQFRRAVKATILLFPLLGINNLLFLYNPGGGMKRTFVILNTVFQSTQGIFVSVLYCFLSSDVRDAIRRQYRRFAARRSANSVRRNARSNRSSKYGNGETFCIGPTTGEQRALFITPTHFRSKFRAAESSRSQPSKSPSPETINNILPSETPSPPRPTA